jgi:hypothetical protein
VRSRSGKLYKKRNNPHNIPEELVPYLPKTAKVVDGKLEAVEVSQTFKDFDEARIGASVEDKKLQEMRERMAKAREQIGKPK